MAERETTLIRLSKAAHAELLRRSHQKGQSVIGLIDDLVFPLSASAGPRPSAPLMRVIGDTLQRLWRGWSTRGGLRYDQVEDAP